MALGRFAWTAAVMLATATWADSATNVTSRTRIPLPANVALTLDKIAAHHREAVKQVMDKPTVFARGPRESFISKPDQYQWLLDHPDRAATAWRKLGAQCVSIEHQGNGIYNWSDGQGSEVTWEVVLRETDMHVWYAHGKVRPAPYLSAVAVHVVVVLRHSEKTSTAGMPVIQHQADVYLHTDSKTAAFLARMLGTSGTRIAEQGLGQMQLFFAGLSWYVYQNPEQSDVLFKNEN